MKLFFFIITLFVIVACSTPETNYASWKIKASSAESIQYSSLNQINKENVVQSNVAWHYQSDDVDTINKRSQIQCIGKGIETFGIADRVSLKEALGERSEKLMELFNSPGVIFKNVIACGGRKVNLRPGDSCVAFELL